jgi:multidrug transporter EmrE-like cation transporter
MLIYYGYIFLAQFFTAAAQLLYKKYYHAKKKIYLILCIPTFCIVPFFNSLALRKIAIDKVYMAISLGITMVIIFSMIFLKEKLSKKDILAIFLIIIGIIIYNL